MTKQIPELAETVSIEAKAIIQATWAQRGSLSFAPPAPAEGPAWRRQLNETFRRPQEAKEPISNDSKWIDVGGVRVLELTSREHEHEERAVLYFHGGAYVMGEAEDGLVHGLAQATKLRIYSSEYRKAPEHPFPAAGNDAFAVYRALVAKHGASNLVVAGCSAGGGLAFKTVIRARDEGLPLPAAVLGITPWLDLSRSGDSILHISPILDPLGSYDDAGLGAAAKSYAAGRDLRDPAISPLHADYTRGFCPVMLTCGTRDWFLSACAQMQNKLRRAGVPVELAVWEGFGHAFEGSPIPEAYESHRYMAAFVRRCLGVAR
jgi:epsilon-lactone hydrolase